MRRRGGLMSRNAVATAWTLDPVAGVAYDGLRSAVVRGGGVE